MMRRAMYLGTVGMLGISVGAIVEGLWGVGLGSLVMAVGLAFPLVAADTQKRVEKGPKGKIV